MVRAATVLTGTIAGLLLMPAASIAQTTSDAGPPMPLTRFERPITVDGHPTEAAWREAAPLPLTMYFPTYRGQPSQRTEIRVGYDDENFYAAGWFYDDQPSGIRINSLYRDRWNGDDAFAIYIDAFNDNQTSKWFGITPAGMRFDLLVSGDGSTLNDSWDGFWDARTAMTPEGWFVEVRIPFSTLGFQSVDGNAVMGLTVTRLVSRTNERVTFPDIDPRFEFRQPSKARDVSMSGVRSTRPVYVTPYALGGASRKAVLDAGASDWVTRSDPTRREIGGDIRFAASPNTTLDLTANTDFAQVEADDQQVNLDRFSLFFPEKRRFFQERSDLFDVMTGGGGRLFHSRRIGLIDNAQPVPVLGGARFVGRAGEWDLGLLGMRTDDLGSTPDENFGVLRARRRILDDYSTVGAMYTSRTGGGQHNNAVGLDARLHLFGDDYLNTVIAATESDSGVGGLSLAERAAAHIQWMHRSSRGLTYDAAFAYAGEAFDPGVGFTTRGDYTLFTTSASYFTFNGPQSTWRRHWPGMVVTGTYRNSDGVLESGRIAAWLEGETQGGSLGWIEPQLFREDVAAPFRIANAIDVPTGGYTFANLWLYWSMPAGRRLRATTDFQTGTYFDGYRTQLMFTPTWNVSPHLELGLAYVGNYLRFGERDQSTDIHVARLRIRTALDARASGNAFVQYNSTTDRLEMNLRLRYNFTEGTDLWIVYNEGLATERLPDPAQPELPRSLSRGLTIKYSRTFTFG